MSSSPNKLSTTDIKVPKQVCEACTHIHFPMYKDLESPRGCLYAARCPKCTTLTEVPQADDIYKLRHKLLDEREQIKRRILRETLKNGVQSTTLRKKINLLLKLSYVENFLLFLAPFISIFLYLTFRPVAPAVVVSILGGIMCSLLTGYMIYERFYSREDLAKLADHLLIYREEYTSGHEVPVELSVLGLGDDPKMLSQGISLGIMQVLLNRLYFKGGNV